ncbi:PD-(D/E)XK nuclease family protein [Ralstonia pickettii]|uniref:RecB family exonuclease n=1 Tax=Ralstonia pickettii TaxID=329 RepID=UPI0015FB2E81|nr:PD-(D/E)XK nuclease family protein [Ralstonia pickettii]MBB0023664.1 PD-(D/E)XK nuclease family protein [Ralstonia pickettii]MBB0096977.1 PD-(D/E)XK nuclease family protein [Ralstonia pickettii]MBB0107053.1 PD-(D/E)XK nuclease family protein [Ralstonia pickettii]MBB0127750.1 PD-(D/E)XK nuclease family protein [Ralstonia pickettii]MBB0160753.1 PD-(D/E)XK nuclease family protein [Ralstonia pickettii]
MKRKPVTIRASSFGSLFDCPARWIAIHLLGKRTPNNVNALLGTSVHHGTAAFDTGRLPNNAPIPVADAKEVAFQAVMAPEYEVDWEDEKPGKVADVAVSLTERYCTLYAPKAEFVAVEISVESLLLTDLDIVLTGHTDRVRRTADGLLGICDVKTGKQAVGTDGTAKAQGHAAQLGVYEIVAQAALQLPIEAPAQIIGLQSNLTPEKQRIGTAEVEGARDVLLGDEEHTGLLHTAAKLVHGEIEPWGNPKSMMCHGRYCPNYATCFWRR